MTRDGNSMRIVGVVGSPRKSGNTHALVNSALEAAARMGAETRLIELRDLRIEGCRGCESCAVEHRCVVDDDMQELYPLLLNADGLILGSPVHFYNVTSLVKAFIDRCYCLEAFAPDDRSCWVGLREAGGGGYAAVITVAEQAEGDYSGFAAEAMSLPLADLGFRVIETVRIQGLWSRGEATGDREALSRAARAGEKLARTIALRATLHAELPEAVD